MRACVTSRLTMISIMAAAALVADWKRGLFYCLYYCFLSQMKYIAECSNRNDCLVHQNASPLSCLWQLQVTMTPGQPQVPFFHPLWSNYNLTGENDGSVIKLKDS